MVYFLKGGVPGWMGGWNSDTGTFQGVPSAGNVGTYTLIIQAWDRNSPTAPTAPLAIRIDSPPEVGEPIPTVTTVAGKPFSWTVPANAFSDPDGDTLSYEIRNSPGWADSFSQTGTLTGTIPSDAAGETHTITILAWDNVIPWNGSEFAKRAENTFTLEVDEYEPVVISTCEELQNIQNDLTGDYVLAADIDCSETTTWDNGAGFKPIGGLSPTTAFKGRLDGNDHQINHIHINRNQNGVGLFSGIQGAEIQNIRLAGTDIKGAGYVGGVCGYAMDASTVTNIHVFGKVSGSGSYIGGVCGMASDSSVSQSGFTGDAVSSNTYVGGLVGYVISAKIAESYSTGAVAGHSYAGGLVGRSDNGAISDSYSKSNVDGSVSGGLIGYGGGVTNCYAAGRVTNTTPYTSYVGGLSSVISSLSAVSSYWNPADSGTDHSGGGVKTTQQAMKQQATYQNWDFEGIWHIREGISYPILKGTNLPAVVGLGFPGIRYGYVNENFGYSIETYDPNAFSDPEGQDLAYYLKGAPAWMGGWDSDTGTFQGVPSAGDAGTYSITIHAWDRISPTAPEARLTIRIDNPPEAGEPIPTVTAVAGKPFSWTVPSNAFTDPDPGDVLSYFIKSSPEWADHFSAETGTLTGTIPEDASGQTHTMMIGAWDWVTPYDGDPKWATDTLTIRVIPSNTDADHDSDGIPDRDETAVYGTRPDNPDTDGDAIWDGDELAFAGDVWNTDSDGDGKNRLTDWDSDGDGVSDGLRDSDGDGVGDWLAFKLGIAAGTQPVVIKTYRYNSQSEIIFSGPVLLVE